MLTHSPSLPIPVCALSRAPTPCRTAMDCIWPGCMKMLFTGRHRATACRNSSLQELANSCPLIAVVQLVHASYYPHPACSSHQIRRLHSMPPDSHCREFQHCKAHSVEPWRHPCCKMCIHSTWAGFLVGLWYTSEEPYSQWARVYLKSAAWGLSRSAGDLNRCVWWAVKTWQIGWMKCICP